MKGPSHVFSSSAVGINNNVNVYTTTPNNIHAEDRRFNGWGSRHPGVCCFVFSDGLTRALSEAINSTVFTAISTGNASATETPDAVTQIDRELNISRPQLSDEQWLLISEFFSVPWPDPSGGRPRADARRCLEGIL